MVAVVGSAGQMLINHLLNCPAVQQFALDGLRFVKKLVQQVLHRTAEPTAEEMSVTKYARLRKLGKGHYKLEAKVARLQLRLLEQETRVKELEGRQALLQKKLEEAFLEVVRAKAKLRSLESKPEAASTLAEAEVALNALKTAATDQERGPEIIQAQHLLKLSAGELNKQNYAGASYLASQAKSLINMGQERYTGKGKTPKTAGEVLFSLPVPLQVLMRANVRNGPGFEYKVLSTLGKGAHVTGHSYKDQWVWVQTPQGRNGWVFHTLVDGR